jgi:glycine oxidase
VAERVAVIGGGIIGCTAAALLAEAGTEVTLFEATAIGAGASGRNSGVLQHPFDEALAGLHARTMEMYREMADPVAFPLPAEPAGILLLTGDPDAAQARAEDLKRWLPELRPVYLDADEVKTAEPSVEWGWAAVRVATGYPVVPESATTAMAARAVRAGVELRMGREAWPWIEGSRVRGVLIHDDEPLHCPQVLVAAGPWTPGVLSQQPSWPAIGRTWGVTVQVELPDAPRHVLEEGVVHTINVEGGSEGSLFSLVAAAGVATVGSTFLADEPNPRALGPRLLRLGARFVPALSEAVIKDVRVCARPQSADGHPFIGAVPHIDGLYVCAGHGPWGMSIGPATAELAVDVMRGHTRRVPLSLRPSRAVPQPSRTAQDSHRRFSTRRQ